MSWCKSSLMSVGKKEAVRSARRILIGFQPRGTRARTCWLQEFHLGGTKICIANRRGRSWTKCKPYLQKARHASKWSIVQWLSSTLRAAPDLIEECDWIDLENLKG